MRFQFEILRSAGHYQLFNLEAAPELTILQALERIRTEQDATLLYRHACHHAACGTCGLRARGKEVLACTTTLKEVAKNGRLRLSPLASLPHIKDLVVDMDPFYERFDLAGSKVLRVNDSLAGEPDSQSLRLESCIECGLCLSSCPVARVNTAYLGPAMLAAAARQVEEGHPVPPASASFAGLWLCRLAANCEAVCPSNVMPATRIAALRRAIAYNES